MKRLAFPLVALVIGTVALYGQQRIYWGDEVPQGWAGSWPAELQTAAEASRYTRTMSSLQNIEFITALHEESAVAAAHGYAKAEGKPMAALLHGVIGVQHAAMAIYNAYVDRVPVIMIAGLDYEGPVAAHNAVDIGSLVRGYTKWDAQPRSLVEALSTIQRAYQIATTPPMAPVLVTLTGEIQKEETAGKSVSCV